ncbi:hypothetical protein Tco_0268039 [Tanacetum coccineum]
MKLLNLQDPPKTSPKPKKRKRAMEAELEMFVPYLHWYRILHERVPFQECYMNETLENDIFFTDKFREQGFQRVFEMKNMDT